jgi:hypothetical protein
LHPSQLLHGDGWSSSGTLGGPRLEASHRLRVRQLGRRLHPRSPCAAAAAVLLLHTAQRSKGSDTRVSRGVHTAAATLHCTARGCARCRHYCVRDSRPAESSAQWSRGGNSGRARGQAEQRLTRGGHLAPPSTSGASAATRGWTR